MNKAKKFLQEIKYIGVKAAAFRGLHLALDKSNMAASARPITPITEAWFTKYLPKDTPLTSTAFLKFWKDQPHHIFIPTTSPPNLMTRAEEKDLIKTAKAAAKGRIKAFRAHKTVDFGWPIKWSYNPKTKQHWPKTHSLKILTHKNKALCGDIKMTWEIGRFLHIPDILRAHHITQDKTLITNLIKQVQSFEKHNPMYQGPHWISEQEVAIRGAMLTLALCHLQNDTNKIINGKTAQLLLRQIAACAQYCMDNTQLARHCIANNHFIASAMMPYIASALMPWHKSADIWHKTSKKWLGEALKTQWFDDGGYIQPSHNYHRLALDYMLWILRVSELRGDDDLTLRIKSRFEKSFTLLNTMQTGINGQLPNWGPNDGAQFGTFTACDYSDFRPTLTALHYALYRKRPFETGKWDEQLFWLWGQDALQSPTQAKTQDTQKSFPQTGLHCFRNHDSFAIFRAGNILSRYGQQADQMHLDLWWRGENILPDPGSYMYSDTVEHNWFRSTAAHNTVSINGESQMIPHRQFLFLNWPRVKVLDLPPSPDGAVKHWVAASHDGYARLTPSVTHTRYIMILHHGGILAVDHLHTDTPSSPHTAEVNWTCPKHITDMADDHVTLHSPAGEFALKWHSTYPATAQLKKAWLSRYYSKKTPAQRLELSCPLMQKNTWIATYLGDKNNMPDTISIDDEKQTITLDTTTIPIPSGTT